MNNPAPLWFCIACILVSIIQFPIYYWLDKKGWMPKGHPRI